MDLKLFSPFTNAVMAINPAPVCVFDSGPAAGLGVQRRAGVDFRNPCCLARQETLNNALAEGIQAI